jgi:hypothetical protein
MAKAPKDKPPKPPKPDKPGKPEEPPIAPPEEGPRIVSASVQWTGHGGIATEPLSVALETAMSEAVTDALKAGVSINDSETILQYKQDARRRVLGSVEV